MCLVFYVQLFCFVFNFIYLLFLFINVLDSELLVFLMKQSKFLLFPLYLSVFHSFSFLPLLQN